ncbi:hypothetical protein RHGRI_001663 [Rhododendron griersonianum]|uniref:Uncharacterized protein n=1 Tax=Rhododendron griersonianum TaxID=479676 RepID=A0AAV6LKX3_9ERIC|nr:hypothetical protein RHGRI_001663 [Rhododendron griersonianum]
MASDSAPPTKTVGLSSVPLIFNWFGYDWMWKKKKITDHSSLSVKKVLLRWPTIETEESLGSSDRCINKIPDFQILLTSKKLSKALALILFWGPWYFIAIQDGDAHSDWVSSVRFSPNTQQPTIVSSSWDRTVKIWNLTNCKIRSTLAGHSGYVNTVAVSPEMNEGGAAQSSGIKNKIVLFADSIDWSLGISVIITL